MAVDSENNGDLLIWDFKARGTDCILDMRVVNTDTALYVTKTPEKNLNIAER